MALKRICEVWAILTLTTIVTAQRTWRVGDLVISYNHFDQIQDAFDAASPGDTIIVERKHLPPNYFPASTNKGVALLSTNAFSFGGQITVEDLPLGQTFVAEGFGGAYATWTFRNCQGAVHVESLHYFAPPGDSCGNGRGVKIRNCRLVTINGSFVIDVDIESSTVLLSDIALYGTPDCTTQRATGNPALRMIDSHVTMADGWIIGARTYPPAPRVPIGGIYMQGGSLRIAGSDPAVNFLNGTAVFVPGMPTAFGPSIESYGGTVVVDPDFDLRHGFAGDSTLVREDLPYMLLPQTSPPSVSQLGMDVFAASGAAVVVAMSLPVSPVATILGDLWLDPSPGGIVAVAMGVMPTGGYVRFVSSANLLWPPGTTPAVQAVVVDQGQIKLSVPSVGVSGVAF